MPMAWMYAMHSSLGCRCVWPALPTAWFNELVHVDRSRLGVANYIAPLEWRGSNAAFMYITQTAEARLAAAW